MAESMAESLALRHAASTAAEPESSKKGTDGEGSRESGDQKGPLPAAAPNNFLAKPWVLWWMAAIAFVAVVYKAFFSAPWVAAGGALSGVIVAIFAIQRPTFVFTFFEKVGWEKAQRAWKKPTGVYELSSYLWLFVFSFGTAAAVLTAELGNLDLTDLKEGPAASLGRMAPRLFVTWFLSVLTMIATRVLSNLEDISRLQEKTRSDVNAATAASATLAAATEKAIRMVERVEQQGDAFAARVERAKDTASGMVKDARAFLTEAAGLVRLEKQFIQLEQSEKGLPTADSLATRTFVEAAQERCELMTSILRSAESSRPTEDIDRLIYDEVLIPALLPYLGSDSWRRDPRGDLSVVQDGGYALYATLIQALFLSMIRYGERLLNKGRRFEVVTTLDIGPANFYNLEVPLVWPAGLAEGEQLKPFVDQWSRTSPRWEHYRAVQALAVDLGRTGRFLGLTRCFVERSRLWNVEPLKRDIWIHRSGYSAREALTTLLKKKVAPWTDPTDARSGDHRIGLSDADLESGVDSLKIGRWLPELEVPTWGIPHAEPRHMEPWVRAAEVGAYAHPVFYEEKGKAASKEEISERKSTTPDWLPLGPDLLEHYFTSPARALRWADVPPSKDLPLDLFAIGISDRDDSPNWWRAPLAADNWKPVILIALESDELGTLTRTRVLLPDQADGEKYSSILTTEVLRTARAFTTLDRFSCWQDIYPCTLDQSTPAAAPG